MIPSELRTLGEQHGHGWQTRLARGLRVDSRTVRRWLARKAKITPQMETLIRQEFEAWRKQRAGK
jgi:hypothetical protein